MFCFAFFFTWTVKLAILRKKGLFILLLTGLFAASFMLPVLFLLFEDKLGVWSDGQLQGDGQALFSNPFRVKGPGVFFRVRDHQGLDPLSGRDFLLLGWFNLKRLPQPGKRIVLLSKYEDHSLTPKGYALGLLRDADACRPVVYWNDRGGKGGWYVFSQMDILPRTWFMLALSFRRDRYLGLHSALYLDDAESPRIQLLGGYDLESAVIPESNAQLVMGSFRTSSLRGMIGTIGIFESENLSEDLDSILFSAAANPGEIPDTFDEQQVKFWSVDGVHDLSSFAHRVERSGEGRPKKTGRKGPAAREAAR